MEMIKCSEDIQEVFLESYLKSAQTLLVIFLKTLNVVHLKVPLAVMDRWRCQRENTPDRLDRQSTVQTDRRGEVTAPDVIFHLN